MSIPESVQMLGTNSDVGKVIFYDEKGIKHCFYNPSTDTSAPYAFAYSNITNFNFGSLNALTDGSYMFYRSKIESFETKLPNLRNGTQMFQGSNIKNFNIPLNNLTVGENMFNGSQYCTFGEDFMNSLDNLKNSRCMFWGSNIKNSSLYDQKFKNVTDAWAMFYGLSTPRVWKEVTFESLQNGSQICNGGVEEAHNLNLKSLTNGSNMFTSCNLDEETVIRILDTIPTYTSGTYYLHIGRRTNWIESETIANLLGTDTPIAAKNYSYKGWTVTVQS